MTEETYIIPCADDYLVAVHHHAIEKSVGLGVIIVVGGPQYRVGSHRQFIELARYLADHGVSVLRFDYRGMGDSSGHIRTFESVDVDIRVAVDAFLQREPSIESVVLWGLCDAASASLMYAANDSRVVGQVLANPWVFTESGEAKTRLKHYYLERFVSRELWRKIFSGKFDWRGSLTSLVGYVNRAFKGVRDSADTENSSNSANVDYVERMYTGMSHYNGSIFLILSGKDLTAAEYRDLVASSRQWKRTTQVKVRDTLEIAETDHTFSSQQAKSRVAEQTLVWVNELAIENARRAV